MLNSNYSNYSENRIAGIKYCVPIIQRRHCSGQASLVLILLAAIALIFFAVTLNWGRVSQMKTMTTTAATNAAIGTVSTIASYAENQIQTTLGGSFKHCKVSSIFSAILTAIVAIVIVALIAFCPAGAVTLHMLIALIVTIAASAASIAITALYIEPKTTQSWNKMQAALPINDRFLEQGLSGAAQGLVSDQSKITDYFDMNANGYFGLTNLKPDGKPDTVSRFGYFYTERLKALKKVSKVSGVDGVAFLNGLRDLQGKLTEDCPVGSMDPHCDACCVPLTADGTPNGAPLRSADCSTDPVPAQCAAADPVYPFIYDPSYPDYANGTSFLAKFGVDSEKRPFNKSDAKGLFSMFWDMEHMRNDSGYPQDPYHQDTYLAQSLNSLGALDSRVTDQVQEMANFKAQDNECTDTKDASVGFWWKRGADRYRSLTWPYDQCACADDTCAACTCTTDTAANWPEDPADDVVYRLKEFFIWSQQLLKQGDDALLQNLDEWYQGDNGAAFWIGPPCNGTNDLVCQQGGGALYALRDRLGAWSSLLDNWLNKDYSAADAWCVPPAGSSMPMPSGQEKAAIDTAAGSHPGNLDSTIACLNYYIPRPFAKCAADLAAMQATQCIASGSQTIDFCGETLNKCAAADDSLGRSAEQAWDRLQTKINAEQGCANSTSGGCQPIGGGCALSCCIGANPLGRCCNCPSSTSPRTCGTCGSFSCSGTGCTDAISAANTDIRNWTTCQTNIAVYKNKAECPAVPGSCSEDTLPRTLNLDPRPPSDGDYHPCLVPPSLFPAWVQKSADLAEPQAVKFQARSTYLQNVKAKAEAAKAAVANGKLVLDDFLSGPVSALVATRTNFQQYLDKLPNFIVYGWQSPADPKNPAAGQRWHLVRAEAQAPGKCSNPSLCNNADNKLPWIKTSVQGFLGRKRCSELTDYNGRALVRVTRWDEGQQAGPASGGAGSSFNNKVILWRDHFGSPNPASGAVPPASALSACIGQGLGNATNYIISSGTPADKQAVNQAFMLNTVRDSSNTGCWDAVEPLLGQGTKTTVCASYGPDALVNPTHNAHHMVVKFDSCPAGAFDENKTLGN